MSTTTASPKPPTTDAGATAGKWMALTAALLGWMFDGMEMGLFPLVGRPALQGLLATSDDAWVGTWFGVITAVFLIGAATGGVFFGWLGDRIGRVRAMALSIAAYALFTGACGLSSHVWALAGFRFLAAMGMGGEWSLGVALVNEVWPDRSRAFLAGLIGAASNVGFLLIGLVGLGLNRFITDVRQAMGSAGMAQQWVDWLTGHSGWRLMMMFGALPGILTFFIQLCVPESRKWEHERGRGTTSNWARRDLVGIAIGAIGAVSIVYLWAVEFPLVVRVLGTVLGLGLAGAGYLYPAIKYLRRCESSAVIPQGSTGPTIRTMILATCLAGVALLGTWASVQFSPAWADKLAEGQGLRNVKEFTQISSALGAIIGTIAGALIAGRFGRRITYAALCIGSLASVLFFYQFNKHFDAIFLGSIFVAGATTAAFYGWFPLYLPELFRTGVRATGQGFSFNFGRILAAIGALQSGFLIKEVFKGDYATACSLMAGVYVFGVVLIWWLPETRGQPLPD